MDADFSGSGTIRVLAGRTMLPGNNTYTGSALLEGGTLTLGSDTALGVSTLTTLGSVVDYADGVDIANPIVIDSDTTQFEVLSGSATQSGTVSEINGPRPFEKIGDGELILAAANTWTGGTTITTLHNAPIAIVDDDNSPLSRRIVSAFYPPNFNKPAMITPDQIDPGLEAEVAAAPLIDICARSIVSYQALYRGERDNGSPALSFLDLERSTVAALPAGNPQVAEASIRAMQGRLLEVLRDAPRPVTANAFEGERKRAILTQ